MRPFTSDNATVLVTGSSGRQVIDTLLHITVRAYEPAGVAAA